MCRYYEAMRTILERHGGTVENFVGDAVMAVFGIPVAHEDDALRAVGRAEMRARACAELGLERARIGVNTGEVVTGERASTLVTGDAVNVAARLEQAAGAGEILIGAETPGSSATPSTSSRRAAEVKGKRSRCRRPASSTSTSRAAARRARLDAPLVGRERERAAARRLRRAVADRLPPLHVLGAGGRREVAARGGVRRARRRRGDRAAGAACPMAKGSRSGRSSRSLRSWARDAEQRRSAASPGTTQLGAFAALLEAAAASDRSSWSSTTSSGPSRRSSTCRARRRLVARRAVLLLCVARPELLDARPGLGRRQAERDPLLLEPLAEEETGSCSHLLGGACPRRRDAATDPRTRRGQPAVRRGDGRARARGDGGGVRRPADDPGAAAGAARPARRGARGDRARRRRGQGLPPGRRASSCRRWCATRSTRARSAGPQGADPSDRRELAGEDAFRFRHQLIRDAAYEVIPKRRAPCCTSASPTGSTSTRRSSTDEFVGYHLEQAARHRQELDAGHARVALLGGAAPLLDSAPPARRPSDEPTSDATRNLLGRAIALLPEGPDRRALLPDLHRGAGRGGRARPDRGPRPTSLERGSDRDRAVVSRSE